MWKSGLAVYTVCFIHCVLWGSAIAKDGLLANGNFEEPPNVWAVVGNVIVGQNLLPKWKISGLVQYVSSGDQPNQKLLSVSVPDEGHAVKLGNNGQISQLVEGLKKGSFYSVIFSVAKTCGKSENLNVTVIPYSQVFPMKTAFDSAGWDTYAWGFKAVAEAHEVVLQNPDEDNEDPNCGPLIDGVAMKETVMPLSKLTAGDLITNGNFEVGPHDFLNGTNGILLPPCDHGHSSLPGWIVQSKLPAKYIDSAHYSVPHGHGAVELISGPGSVLSQTVHTAAGKSYRVSFAVGDGNNKCVGLLRVQVIAGNRIFRVPYESNGTGGFKIAEFTFTARLPTTRIAFTSLSKMKKSDNSGSVCGPVVDQVKVVAV